MIPAVLFVRWLRESATLTAASQYRQVLAVQLGAASVMDAKNASVARAMRALKRAAEG